MAFTTCPPNAYPPAALAHAVAVISVALPGASLPARLRLAAFMAACDAHPEWSDATRAALARRGTAWLALARFFGQSIDRLMQLDSAVLLDRLGRRLGDAGRLTTRNGVSAPSA